jgi:hypothetical protein
MKLAGFFIAIALLLTGCSENAEDNEIAKKVGWYLDAAEIIPKDTGEAYKTHVGKIVFVSPGTKGRPHFIYYEVTAEKDMQKLKEGAEEALTHVPEANIITLHFMEKQVFHHSSGGGGHRGMENEINKIVVARK